MTCAQRRDQMPLYVADAMDAAERAELRNHLAAGCAACAGHLAEAQATFAALPLELDAVAPSPDLLRRIMERIDQTPANGRPMSIAPSRKPAWQRWLLPLASAAAAVALASAVTDVIVSHRNSTAYSRELHQVDVRASLIQAAIQQQEQTADELRQKLAEQQQLVDTLRSPETRVVELAGTPGQPRASAHLVWAPALGRSVLLTAGLAPPPPGRTYELWYITADQKKVRAGTFGVDVQGSTTLMVPVPPGLPPLAVAAVTDEPAGGSAAPTGTIQMAGEAP